MTVLPGTIRERQERLFFIIGIGRSGTSLLQEIMNTFDGFCNVGESRTGPERTNLFHLIGDHLDFDPLERFIAEHWTNDYFVEKTPGSIRWLAELNDRYPLARYIFLERHPVKILLSALNYQGFTGFTKRFRDEVKLETDQDVEVFWAGLIEREVRRQAANKHLFEHQATVRYESMVHDVDRTLSMLEETFGIHCDREKARAVMARPSYSSRKNRYDIRCITERASIEKMEAACSLWGYSMDDIADAVKPRE